MNIPFKNYHHYGDFASKYLGSTVDRSLTGCGRAICTVLSNPFLWFSKESASNSDSSVVISEEVNLFPEEIWQELNGLTEWIHLDL